MSSHSGGRQIASRYLIEEALPRVETAAENMIFVGENDVSRCDGERKWYLIVPEQSGELLIVELNDTRLRLAAEYLQSGCCGFKALLHFSEYRNASRMDFDISEPFDM